MHSAKTKLRTGLTLAMFATLAACSGEGGSDMDSPGDDAGLEQDGASEDDGSVAACPATGTGTLAIELVPSSGLAADVRVSAEDGTAIAGSPFAAASSVEVSGGTYSVEAGRVMVSDTIVGSAYQGEVEGGSAVCVRDGETTTVRVIYTREPGSAKLWLTHSNGDDPAQQILAFDPAALAAGGTHDPSVTLDGKLTSPSALRVDALGRLWVGDRTGKVVGFASNALGESSTEGPAIVLEGDGLCGATLPCGPRALAFDAEGALWVALLERIVKFAPASLSASGEPEPEVTIVSPDAARPISLAFDGDGNLWVGEDENSAVVKFAATRLTADIDGEAADVVITAEQGPPVTIGLGIPDGLTFDRDGNLWVGYFAGNNLARFTPEELEASATLTPSVLFDIDVTALVTDLAIDESGNLWMPGSTGTVARIDAAELLEPEPAVVTL
jgi:sugar lactone lactonase YvrE